MWKEEFSTDHTNTRYELSSVSTMTEYVIIILMTGSVFFRARLFNRSESRRLRERPGKKDCNKDSDDRGAKPDRHPVMAMCGRRKMVIDIAGNKCAENYAQSGKHESVKGLDPCAHLLIEQSVEVNLPRYKEEVVA